ncbi:MAG: heme-binding protein, partial [Planctomycetaceae bacterium]
PDLPTGVMRGRFHPTDGQLYACGLFAWAGNRTQPGGFFRIRRTAELLRMPVALHAAPESLSLTFAEPLDSAATRDAAAWQVKAWNLKRSANYGSEHLDERSLPVESVELSSDGRTATLRVPEFAATWCYSVEWTTREADGTPVKGVLHGTLHERATIPLTR